MNHRSAVSVCLLSILHLIFVIRSTGAVRTDYGELLANERVQEKLKLLLPEEVLKNYTIDADGAVSRNCLRSLDIYQRARQNREIWALKSNQKLLFRSFACKIRKAKMLIDIFDMISLIASD